MNENERSKAWILNLYPDNDNHINILAELNRGYSYVGILHDKDVYEDGEKKGEVKKSHWHIIVRFPSQRWGRAVAAELGIEGNLIERCRDFNSAALYLTHTGYPEKYQYDTDDLFGPLTPSVIKLHEGETDINARVKCLLDTQKATDRLLDVWSLIEMACEMGAFPDLMRLMPVIKDICDIHNARIMNGNCYRKEICE